MTPVVHSNFSEHISAIIEASRPAGWCFGPILFAIGLIHSRSIPRNFIARLMAMAQVLSLSFPLCTIVFGMNDVYDYDSDLRNPRKTLSGLEGGILAPAYHSSVRVAAQISTIAIFVTSLATLRLQNSIAASLLVLVGWQYSASPFRLKEVPLIDSLSNGLIVLLTWLVGYTFGGGSIFHAPSKGYTLALCTAGVHALGAVIDVDSDVAAGQQTVATFLGPRPAAFFGAFAYAIALLTDRTTSVFGIYLWGGLVTMMTPCLRLQWAHQAFKAVVYWTVTMSMVWIGSKALTSRTRR